MNKVVAILFAISCFATSAISNNLLGAGMWFWIIVCTGLFVAVSQFLPALRDLVLSEPGSAWPAHSA